MSSFKKIVVEIGDSLYKIAKNYNVSIEEIMKLNNLTSDVIYPKQVLFIPQSNNSFKYITKEETLNDIILKEHLNKDEILKLNDLFSLKLASGNVINIKNNLNETKLNNKDLKYDYMILKNRFIN